MPYYRTCPVCGANLDPWERCTCQDKEEAAPDATNTQSGKVESELSSPHSTSDFNKRLGGNQA